MAKLNIPTFKLNNGHYIPAVGFGTWLGFDDKSNYNYADFPHMKKALAHAIEIGYRHIDTAHLYRVEPEVGEVINEQIDKKIVKREELFITTKVWQHFHRRGDVEVSLRGSLRRLNLDYVDLVLVHWPFSASEDGVDEKIDYLETWRGFEDVLAKGLTKGIGVSNFNVEQMKRLLANCKIPPAVNQIEVNLNLSQKDIVEYCKANNVVVEAYSPMGTMVSSRLIPGSPEPKLDHPTMVALAAKYKKTVSQIVFRFLYQKGLVVIPKTITVSRLEENANIFDFHLDEGDVATLAAFDVHYRTVNPIFHQYLENYPFEKIDGTPPPIPRGLMSWKNGVNSDVD